MTVYLIFFCSIQRFKAFYLFRKIHGLYRDRGFGNYYTVSRDHGTYAGTVSSQPCLIIRDPNGFGNVGLLEKKNEQYETPQTFAPSANDHLFSWDQRR